MSPTTPTLSDEEIDRQFNEVVALCKKLQEDKCLCSGFAFGVTSDGRVGIQSLPPETDPNVPPPDLSAIMQQALSAHQQLRHALAKSFDMSSITWNASAIGRMLTYVEGEFRKETYKVEDDAEGKKEKQPYNAFTIVFLTESVLELYALVLSREFTKKWRRGKLRVLNGYADRFFNRNRNKAWLQQMSMVAELIITFEKVRQARGSEEGVKGFTLTIVQSGILNALKTFFKET